MKSYKNKAKLLQRDFINTELKLCSYFEGVLVIKVLIFNKMPCQRMHAYTEDLTSLLMQQIYVPTLPSPPLK